ncbi:hypothetical protein BD410DRAFT_806764 [Rickenella mellea]|uniref:BTB domain-containing protein n=1 Tax=Rickenella mellea TaxID=50990 RepID=A0A4Y7PT27_9AGAM|nr:hypothetical protein BD410DRAFT_806764 [Rickenella mellea]
MTLRNETIDIATLLQLHQVDDIEDDIIWDDDEGYMTPPEDEDDLAPRDGQFFLEMLVLKVEGCLFNVPRIYFEQSWIFQDMFSLPLGQKVGEGSSTKRPLVLDGVKADDFRPFLDVLIRLPSNSLDSFTKDQWVAVLHLATMWEFKMIRALSIEKLSAMGMTAVERILVARREDIPDWLIASHGHLITLETFPSIHAMEELGGLQFCLKLAKAREAICKNGYHHDCSWNWADHIPGWYSVAVELFGLPNDAMDQLNRDLQFIDYVEPVDEDELTPDLLFDEDCEPAIPEKPKKKKKGKKISSQRNPLVYLEN